MESKSQNPGLVRDSHASLGDRGKETQHLQILTTDSLGKTACSCDTSSWGLEELIPDLPPKKLDFSR